MWKSFVRENPVEVAFFCLLAVLSLILLMMLVSWPVVSLVNLPGLSQARAEKSMEEWTSANKITFSRASCAYDSDDDGYGSCTITLESGEKIELQCIAGFFTKLTGASGCKEIDARVMIR